MPISRGMSTVFGLLAILLWASTVAVGRSLTEQIGTLTAATIVYLGGGVIGLGWLGARGKLRIAVDGFGKRYLFGVGGLFVLNNVTLYLAIGTAANRLQVLEIGLVNYLWPMLTILLSVPILKLHARWTLLPGALIGTVGIFLALTQNQPVSWESFTSGILTNPAAYLFAFTAGSSWALYNNLSRRWGSAATASGAVPYFLAATGLVLLGLRLAAQEQPVWSTGVLGELAFMVVAPNAAYIMWEYGMRRGDIVLVASASYFTPLFSTLISVVYLSVHAGPKLWIGCLLIIAGAAACRLSLREERPPV